MDSSRLSAKDEKILQVIFQQIGKYPDDLKYQMLNVKNLSNILNNCALSLNLLIKFGFIYTPNKSQLTFVGVSQYMYHEDEIIALLHGKKLRFTLTQAAICACFRADKDTRQIFDSNSPPFGVFRTTLMKPDLTQNNQVFFTSWKNRTLSDKIQITLRAKEMCNLGSFEDLFELHYISKCNYTKKFKKLQLYVLNNQGLRFGLNDWDGMDIDKLIYDIYQKFESDHQLLVKFDQICSIFLSTTDKDENKVNFFKKCLFFSDGCFRIEQDQQRNRFQKFHCKLLSTLHKYEYLWNKLSNICVYQIQQLMEINECQCTEDLIEQHMNNIVKPKIEKIKKSKKVCKYIKNSILSKKEDNVGYVWKCLLCNTFNNYNLIKYNDFCSSCEWNQWNDLYSVCPLYFMQKNQSITFGINPLVKPFYIIYDGGGKPYDFNQYRYIQAMMENNNHSKLSTIVVGRNHTPSNAILFEKSNPLTFYDLKHLLFEIHLFGQEGENKAKMWTFGDILFRDPNDPNILNKLSDDSIIDIVEPCFVDLNQIIVDFKLRKPVEFGKDKFDQGYYHSCCNTDNVNINIKNNNINDNNENKGQDENCGVMKPVNKRIETSDVTEVFDFEYSSFGSSTYHVIMEMHRFINDKSAETTRINRLLHLVKEVISNGYERDLLPIIKIVDNDASINMIDKIVHEYEKRTNTSILNRYNGRNGNCGIFNKFNMGLIRELSKVYKIFDQDRLQSKMFHKRHKRMGYPLCCYEMLSLMLYCDGECNYDLCKSQRSHTQMKKWPYFHCMLHVAIEKLSKFEIHYEHIYTGICGAFFEANTEVKEARLNTNVSFSTDLNVALRFRGDSGMVIGMNMKRIVNDTLTSENFDACDVSWISSFDFENEILCQFGSKITIYSNLVRKRGNTQWIAIVEDELDDDKAFKSIFGTLAD